jgi:hypothetical protein
MQRFPDWLLPALNQQLQCRWGLSTFPVTMFELSECIRERGRIPAELTAKIPDCVRGVLLRTTQPEYEFTDEAPYLMIRSREVPVQKGLMADLRPCPIGEYETGDGVLGTEWSGPLA